MAKRVADEQITKDGFEGSSDGDDAPQGPVQASNDVLSKRKILKPRGRLGTQPSGSSGFNGFSNVQMPQSSLFSFGNGNGNTTTAPASNPFGSLKQQGSTTIVSNDEEEKNNKIRALNENFVKAVNKLNVPNTIADFTTIAQKYIDYYKSISNVKQPLPVKPQQQQQPPTATTSTFQFKPSVPSTTTTTSSTPMFSFKPPVQESKPAVPSSTAVNAPSKPMFSFNPPASASSTTTTTTENSSASTTANVPLSTSKPAPSVESNTIKKDKSDSESDSDDDDEVEEKKDIKVEGPKFTLATKPTVKSSPFTFDPKKLAKKNAPDSDDLEDEIEIKGPTFQFNKPIKDSVFKLPTTDSSKPFTFGEKKEDNNNDNDTKKPQNAFSLPSTSDKKEEPKPLFGLSKPEDKPEVAKPLFTFGKPVEEAAKPLFTFGKPVEEAAKPAFTFGSASKSTDAKPAFSFGTPAATTTENKPDTKESSTNTTAPMFKFGAPSTTSSTSTPSFNFKPQPTATTTATDASAKAEGDKASSAPTTSLFGAVSSDKPAFSFNSGASKPFTFGTPSNSEQKTESTPTPAFNFNTSSSTATSTFGLNKPTFGFSFGKTDDKKPESKETATAASEQPQQEEKEEETGGNFTPIAKLSNEKIEQTNGEENEIVKFTIRSKLMEFDSNNKENPYINKGLGELKILYNEKTAKSRILIRSDGSLRILLNTLILKSINYESIGNGSLIRIPTIDPNDASKIITYVVKVKTAENGSELLKTINELK